MSTFVLKIIALISMLFDHSGYVIFNGFSYFNYIGRLAFPIFAFLITEGYIHTKDLKKYFTRLFIWALISEIPFVLFRTKYVENTFSLNVLFTLFFGLATIWCYDKNKTLGSIMLFFSSLIAEICKFDYGAFGIIAIFIFYVFKDNKILMNIIFALIVFVKYLDKFILFFNTEYFSPYLLLCLFTITSLIFINLYNKKEGKKIKYSLYVFYPLHLLILYLL